MIDCGVCSLINGLHGNKGSEQEPVCRNLPGLYGLPSDDLAGIFIVLSDMIFPALTLKVYSLFQRIFVSRWLGIRVRIRNKQRSHGNTNHNRSRECQLA
jgi:hypothetical protein